LDYRQTLSHPGDLTRGRETRYNAPIMAHKILVVDDEMTLLHTVRAYLEQEGYTVQTASDGHSALYAFRDFQPDLVVLDIMLPELNGLEVLRQLRQTSDTYV